jgi:predicted AAA+ superfamily ATPase
MQRNISQNLQEWAKRNNRKPLIISGARQIGKSWVVRELGKDLYQQNFLEVNFEKTPLINQLFEANLDPKRIVQELEIQYQTEITADTLLFFDEIQNCPKAIMALRYFYEEMPQIPVIAAGSLLEFQLKNIPFPVGRVEHVEMYPMSFDEFLLANGNKALVKLIKEPIQEFASSIEDKLYRELLDYYWVGGMPECVSHFVENRNYMAVRKIQQDLIYTYTQDFAKYDPLVNKDCLLDILYRVANNVGNQTIYTKLSDRFSGPTIKTGVEVLKMAKILTKVNNVSIANLPFTVSGKQFKLYFLDIGLLMCIANVPYQNLMQEKNLNAVFAGAWAEQFVAQSLLCNYNKNLNYWARAEKNSNAEVDFVIEQKGEIIPIEVKYGSAGRLRSLHQLMLENSHIQKAIIYSKAKLGVQDKLNFVPIYYAGKID